MDKKVLFTKLSSRKFWTMIIGLATSSMVLFGVSDNKAAQVVAVIGAFGSVVSYILAEAYVDGKSAGAPIEIYTDDTAE